MKLKGKIAELKRRYHLVVRSVKYFFQRRTRGWDDSETWSLDFHMAKFLVPRLKRFKQLNCAYPYGLTFEEWEQELDEMIFAFEWYADDRRWDRFGIEYADDWKRAEAGAELFGKRYNCLWW